MRGYRQRALKDYQIMLEFRHLKLHAPAGVYILPSFDSLREWSGVLFVRSGVYKGGIFRFSMQLPRSYPANGACPRVLFQSRVFHPHVHPQTGQVDILSHFGGHWVAGEHYIVLVLQVLKSMMHVTPQKDLSLGMGVSLRRRKKEQKKSESGSAATEGVVGDADDTDGNAANARKPTTRRVVMHPAALRMWEDSSGAGRLDYLKQAKACVAFSIADRFNNPEGSVIQFAPPVKQHESMMRNLAQTGSIRGSPFVMSPKILTSSPPRRGSRHAHSQSSGDADAAEEEA